MSEQIKKVCVGGGGTIQPKKNKEILPFETIWAELDGIILNEMSNRRRQILYDHTFM